MLFELVFAYGINYGTLINDSIHIRNVLKVGYQYKETFGHRKVLNLTFSPPKLYDFSIRGSLCRQNLYAALT